MKYDSYGWNTLIQILLSVYMQTSLLFQFLDNHACYHRSRSIHQKVLNIAVDQ